MKKISRYFPLFLAFLLGMVATRAIGFVSAHGGDTNLIHGCVKSGVLNSGFLRIISTTGTCNSNETPLDWNIQGIPGTNANTTGSYLPDSLTGSDLNDLDMRYRDFSNLNFSGSNLAKVRFSYGNFENTNFSGAIFSPNENPEANNANFKNTNFSNTAIPNFWIVHSDLTNSDFSNTLITESFFEDTVLTDSNFNSASITNSNFRGAITTEATFAGVTWNNVVCPDNTNSNDHGNTCDGHLNP